MRPSGEGVGSGSCEYVGALYRALGPMVKGVGGNGMAGAEGSLPS